mgnify:FL=1
MRGICFKINPTLLTMNSIDYCLLKDIVIQLIFQLEQDYIGPAHIPNMYVLPIDLTIVKFEVIPA